MSNWSHLRTKLTAQLTQSLAHSDKIGKLLPSVTNPLPLNTSQQQLREWTKLHSILHESITNIIHNFNEDQDIQNMINLSDAELHIINQCTSHDYHIGSFRPDLLIERNTQQTKICEINARFVTNGYVMTPHLSDAVTNLMRYPYPTAHELFGDHLDFTKPVFVIKGREYGNDIHLLKSAHPETVHIIHIDDVKCDPHNNTLFRSDPHIPIEQIVLELHQDEILSLPPPIIHTFCEMMAKKKLLNDFRTIFIVHNKTFLNLLANADIMTRYIPKDDIQFLNKFLIKSYCKLDLSTSDILDHVIEDKDAYVLKPILLGKGEGIIFGDECTNSEWYDSIQSNILDHNTYVLQEYIEQELFEFQSVLNGDWVQQNIVATLLCYGDAFYGPGVNRSSPSRLIAVSRGGEILLPQIAHDDDKHFTIPTVLEQIFDHCTLQYHVHDDVSCASDKILAMLESKQKCLVELVDIDIDKESSIMQDIVRHIGIAHTHDKERSVLWDVKPGHGELARSHGDKSFELHTDASFDKIVPRYFGLHVIKHDRFGGGLNQLICVDDVVSKLQPFEVDYLLKHKFRITIPLEFRKNDGVQYNYGAVLGYDDVLNRYIMRYRRDIIDTNDLDDETWRVLSKLECVLDEVQQESMLIQIPENHILFADNCCYLHSRTEIKDHNRHIRRIRFHPKQSELLPNF
eukprot:131143_1